MVSRRRKTSHGGRAVASPAVTTLIASDLDGTLLRSDGTLSDRTARAVQACEDAGMTMVIATGRPPRWIDRIGEQLGHRGMAVCCNGALIYDLAAGAVVSSTMLAAEVTAEIALRLRRQFPGVLFAVESATYLGLEPAWKTAWTPPAGTRIGEVADLVTEPVVKLLARLDGGEVEAALAATAAELTGIAEVTWSGGQHLLELSAPGVSKGRALAGLAASFGIDARAAVAFGDMPNDLDMLTWAGRGLAVANAHPMVLAAADAVVGANDDDGVAAELERLLDGAG